MYPFFSPISILAVLSSPGHVVPPEFKALLPPSYAPFSRRPNQSVSTSCVHKGRDLASTRKAVISCLLASPSNRSPTDLAR
ncbi:unnamed protein product [Protopolystoma xenopodis]|uniref:Uncharacterized protein n=1 Tax=Protopolystoma xenopodis TaxID=117903 RepID=A0A448WDT2_9PLAT|nr:unnamed protein product [Protopolystoma xenopodis]